MAKKKSAGTKYPHRFWLIIVSAVVAAALLLGFGIAFNLAGMGVKTNNLLASLPITGNYFKAVDEVKTPEQLEREELEKTKRLIEEERINLDELSGRLASWELQLKAKEEELTSQKEVVDDLQYRLEARVKTIEELVVYYEKMDAADAVEILNNIYDNRLVITILRNMKEQKCSEILAEMDPKKAARLMETMSAQ